METLIVGCPTCSARVEAVIRGFVEYFADGDRPGGRYALASCKACGGPFLIQQTNLGNQALGDVWDDDRRLYPPASLHINPAAPQAVQYSFAEAVTVHEAGAHTATAIMCRRALQGVCAEHGANENNLAKSLSKLRDTGVINDHLFEWADMLRITGNEAAHDVDALIPRDDARDMLELTGAIIDYVFSFRDKFVAFKARRGSRPRRRPPKKT